MRAQRCARAIRELLLGIGDGLLRELGMQQLRGTTVLDCAGLKIPQERGEAGNRVVLVVLAACRRAAFQAMLGGGVPVVSRAG